MTSQWSLDQRVMLGASYTKSAPSLVWCWYILCRWRNVFYLPRDSTRPLRCDVIHVIYGWELSQHVFTLKRLVTIGILDQKHESFKYVLPLKNWVNWITTRQEKNGTTSKNVHFEKKCPKSSTSITLLLKQKPLELKRWLSPFWKLEMPMMLLCMFGLFILK